MAREWIGGLVAELHAGKISRREFAKRAAALGLSAGLIGQALSVAGTRAQDASPMASPGASPAAGTIGRADVARVTDTSQGIVRFYSSWPLTGASEQIGGDSVASCQMALEDFGAAAGGFAVEYEALDDGIAQNNGAWDAGKEAENANRVVNDEDAMVYIATYNSGAAAISIPIMNEAGMAMISPANTYPGLTQAVEGVTESGEPDKYYPTGNRNYMRPTVADHLQGGATANWAVESGFGTAYILHDNQLYGKGLAQAFRVYYEQLGGAVAGFEAYQPDAPDYQALATSIADRGPAMVYIGAIVNLNPGKLVQDLRSVMPPDQVTIVVPDGCFNQAFIDSAGDAAEETYATFGGVPPTFLESEVGQDWLARIRERVGHDPDSYATYAYEATVIALQALDQVQAKDRQQILDAMFATRNFNGLSGTYSFTETGDPDRPAIFLGQIRDGEIQRVDYITPPAS